MALDGGIDIIEHGYGIEEDTRKRLVDENALVVSTIAQLYFHEQAADPFHYPGWLKDVFQTHIDRMRHDFELSLRAGVRYALGTDLIGFPTHPQNAGAKEFELAVEVGHGHAPSARGRDAHQRRGVEHGARDRLAAEGAPRGHHRRAHRSGARHHDPAERELRHVRRRRHRRQGRRRRRADARSAEARDGFRAT